jgi:hypothetical protein
MGDIVPLTMVDYSSCTHDLQQLLVYGCFTTCLRVVCGDIIGNVSIATLSNDF